MKNEIIETRIVRIWLEDDGIFRVTALPGVEATLEDFKEINEKMMNSTRGKRFPFFVDIRGVRSVTREVRMSASSEDSAKVCSAAAFLIGSPVSRVIGNFFLGFNKPPYPLKLFTSENEAIEWLKQYVEMDKD